MYWDIIVDIKCNESDLQKVQDRLICHHSIWSAIPEQERLKETKSTQGAPTINTYTGYKTIKCQASVFHKNDEVGLEMYLRTIKEIELIHFIPLSTKDKTKQIFQTSKYPAIIVLVIIFSHEAILIFAKEEQTHLEPWLLTIGFSVIGFFATLIIDSVMIWKEHHN